MLLIFLLFKGKFSIKNILKKIPERVETPFEQGGRIMCSKFLFPPLIFPLYCNIVGHDICYYFKGDFQCCKVYIILKLTNVLLFKKMFDFNI